MLRIRILLSCQATRQPVRIRLSRQVCVNLLGFSVLPAICLGMLVRSAPRLAAPTAPRACLRMLLLEVDKGNEVTTRAAGVELTVKNYPRVVDLGQQRRVCCCRNSSCSCELYNTPLRQHWTRPIRHRTLLYDLL